MKLKKEHIKYFLLIIGIYILFYVSRQIDVARFSNVIKSIGLAFILLFIILCIEVYLKALRFKLLISSVASLPVMGIFSIIFETLVFTVYTPGRFGELTKLQLLKDRYNISRRKSIGVLTVERFFDIIVIGFFSLNSLILISDSLSIISISIAAIVSILLATSGLLFARRFNIFIEYVEPLVHTIRGIFINKNVILAFIMTPAIWMLEALIPYIILYKLNYEINFFILTSVYFASSLIGLLSLIPGAVGSLEFSFTYLLNHQLGVANDDAVSAILLTRGISLLFLVIGLIQFYRHKKF